jgi:outer membrane biogenesis lipoprotein LolB
MQARLILIATLLLLSACDSSPPPAEHKPNPILDPQTQALKKARAVQGQVDAAAEAQRKQIEAAEQ